MADPGNLDHVFSMVTEVASDTWATDLDTEYTNFKAMVQLAVKELAARLSLEEGLRDRLAAKHPDVSTALEQLAPHKAIVVRLHNEYYAASGQRDPERHRMERDGFPVHSLPTNDDQERRARKAMERIWEDFMDVDPDDRPLPEQARRASERARKVFTWQELQQRDSSIQALRSQLSLIESQFPYRASEAEGCEG